MNLESVKAELEVLVDGARFDEVATLIGTAAVHLSPEEQAELKAWIDAQVETNLDRAVAQQNQVAPGLGDQLRPAMESYVDARRTFGEKRFRPIADEAARDELIRSVGGVPPEGTDPGPLARLVRWLRALRRRISV